MYDLIFFGDSDDRRQTRLKTVRQCVEKNFRSEEFSCGCFNSHWRNRRESSERGDAASVRF